MFLWIKYRPSRWGEFLSENSLRPLITFIKKEGGKKFILVSPLIFSLLFAGVIPTLNFIWSNILRLCLIPLVIPTFYWVFAIISVYMRVIIHAFFKFVRVLFDKFIKR
tara:strand:+ start:1324 stop:1647 length:324 start_codon:yes stop_codon:yes gene_type:complete